MTAHTPIITGELVDDFREFFAPAASDLVDGLVGEYGAMRARIEALAAAVAQEKFAGALHHFVEGNLRDERHSLPSRIERLFDLEGAVAHLNASYWDRALKLTDVLDVMPQKRRDQWFEQIQNPLGKKADRWSREGDLPPIPEFTEDAVRATLGDLLMSRSKFFAERVDGIFKALSRDHVTNQPQGFGKRMILQRAISSYGTVETSTAGVINDLRCVIARFMGRDEPGWRQTDEVIRRVRQRNGEWAIVDGGALRIRVYNGVGTAHLEVHPDMAWRLNAVLASIYPAAIPESMRTRPKKPKKVKDFELFDRPLPFAVINLLADMKPGVRRRDDAERKGSTFIDIPMTRRFGHGDHDKVAKAEAEKVLAAIGGVCEPDGLWHFDYEPGEVLDEIVCSGCIPDQKSHQFYPTPAGLAQRAVELAEIGPDHRCLEPSAGTGALADLMPKDRTLCVEFSGLHRKVLEAKGHKVVCGDFLPWAAARAREGMRFDRVVMNPPFSEGRWALHLEHAAQLLAPGGRLVAILPATAKGKEALPGFSLAFDGPYSNEFAGTSVSVVIMTADRPI